MKCFVCASLSNSTQEGRGGPTFDHCHCDYVKDIPHIFGGETHHHPHPLLQAEKPDFFYILKTIFNLPQELYCKFLLLNNGTFDLGSWGNVCESCELSIRQFYGVLQHVSELQKILPQIQAELNGRMDRSMGNDDDDDDHDQGQGWSQVRKDVLNWSKSKGLGEVSDITGSTPWMTENKPQLVVESGTPLISANGDDDEDHQMANEVEWRGRDDEPTDDVQYQNQGMGINKDRQEQSDEMIGFDNHLKMLSAAPTKKRSYFYKCSLCPHQTNNKPAMESHRAKHIMTPHEPAGSVPGKVKKIMNNQNHLNVYRTVEKKKRKSTTVTTPRVRTYNCNLCPFKASEWEQLAFHRAIHKEQESNVNRGDPGIFTQPQKKEVKKGKPYTVTVYYKQTTSPSKRKGPPPKRLRPRRRCPKCPYKSFVIARLKKHFRLHQNQTGSGCEGIPCPECGVYFLKSRLKWHQSLFHPTGDGNNGPRRIYNCTKCSYKSKCLPSLKAHCKVHEEGSGAIPCEKCGGGILVMPSKMAQHCGQLHPPTSSQEDNDNQGGPRPKINTSIQRKATSSTSQSSSSELQNEIFPRILNSFSLISSENVGVSQSQASPSISDYFASLFLDEEDAHSIHLTGGNNDHGSQDEQERNDSRAR